MSNTKSIGVAFLDQDIVGSQYIMSGEQLGYSSAALGSVTQLTDKATAVTLNKSAGQITMNAAALGAATNATFILNNSLLSARDVIVLNINGGTTAAYNAYVSVVGAGSATITLRNITAGSLSEAVVINYAILHVNGNV